MIERMTTTPPGQRLLLAAAVIVATAAGIVGAIMLIAPSSTGRSFAWPLGPRALAALVGGFYVVSAPVFAYAGRRSAIEVRGLAAAVLAFTIPTVAATYLHRDVFDFDRLFAMAWVVLFIASPVTFALLLWSGRHAQPPPGDPRVRPAARAVLAALAVMFAGLAAWFWINTSGPVPFEMAPLGARFLAAWLAFFAVLAAWPAVRPTRSEARVPLLALIAYGIGGLLAAAVHPQDLGSGVVGYLAALVVVVAIPALVLVRGVRG
ncbi:MAG TPA: hypothetical protein VNT24_01135 [Propionibacteriaceae bacterium]|nr:hypothetical protein [Propionibacteriaceae bacterium]